MSEVKSKDNSVRGGKFRCPLDGLTFETKADLDRHIRNAHVTQIGLTLP